MAKDDFICSTDIDRVGSPSPPIPGKLTNMAARRHENKLAVKAVWLGDQTYVATSLTPLP